MGLRTICLALFLFGAVPLSAMAQPNPEVANCEAIKDPDTEFQAQVCSAHVACGFVMGVQRTCTKVKSFLRNLGTAVQNAGKRLTGSKDINAEDVFEAQIEPVHRQIDKDPGIKGISDRTKAASKDVANSEPKVLTTNGRRELFYGDPSGPTSGNHYAFREDGNSFRGSQGPSGEQEAIGANGVRRVGAISEGRWGGPGGYVDEVGTVFTGTFSKGFFGEGTRKNPDGTTDIGRFVREGSSTNLAEGQKFDRNGNLIARGKFSGAKLVEGEQRDSSGRMVAVGGPPVQQAASPPQNVQQPQRPQQAVAQNQPSAPSPVGQQTTGTRPVQPSSGWQRLQLPNGCAMLTNELQNDQKYFRYDWNGACVNGLTHGPGTMFRRQNDPNRHRDDEERWTLTMHYGALHGEGTLVNCMVGGTPARLQCMNAEPVVYRMGCIERWGNNSRANVSVWANCKPAY